MLGGNKKDIGKDLPYILRRGTPAFSPSSFVSFAFQRVEYASWKKSEWLVSVVLWRTYGSTSVLRRISTSPSGNRGKFFTGGMASRMCRDGKGPVDADRVDLKNEDLVDKRVVELVVYIEHFAFVPESEGHCQHHQRKQRTWVGYQRVASRQWLDIKRMYNQRKVKVGER